MVPFFVWVSGQLKLFAVSYPVAILLSKFAELVLWVEIHEIAVDTVPDILRSVWV